MLTLLCVAPLTLADQQALSTQQQCAEYGVYQDASGNWVECAGSNDGDEHYIDSYVEEPYVEEPYTEEPYTEDSYVEEPYVEDNYIERPYIEQPYTEESYVE